MKWDADAPCSFSSSSLWPSSGGFAARESRQEAGSSAPLVSEGGAHSRIGWCSTLHSSQLPLRYPSRDVGTPCEMTTYTPPGLRTRCISLTILLTCGRHAAHRLSSRGAVRGGRGGGGGETHIRQVVHRTKLCIEQAFVDDHVEAIVRQKLEFARVHDSDCGDTERDSS